MFKLPFGGIINIVSFGVDVYKKVKRRKRYEKDAETIAELEGIIDNNDTADTNNSSNKLRNKTSKDNRQ